MRSVWSKVLKVPAESINLDDSFMSLGSSSLEAIMVTSTARTSMVETKAQDVMMQESLRDVAKVSRRIVAPLEQASIPPFSLLHKGTSLNHTSLANAWPVTPSQEPLIADLLSGGSQYIYNKVIRLKSLSITNFKTAFTKLYIRNAFLRSTFIEHGNTYLQLIQTQASIP